MDAKILRRGIKALGGIALMIGIVHAIPAEAGSLFRTQGGKAIEGYDAVAYFEQNRPVKGKQEFSVSWRGARWLFANVSNKAQFQDDPQRYAPQFGGYCAWAASQGYKARGDPHQWSVYRGKLYLNYNASIKRQWKADKVELIAKAEKNWPDRVQ